MDKKTILAILLSAVVWITWAYFFKPDEQNIKRNIPQTQNVVTDKTTEKINQSNSKSVTSSIKVSNIKVSNIKNNQNEQIFDMETKKFKIKLSTKGGSIVKLVEKARNLDYIVSKSKWGKKGILDFRVNFSEKDFLAGNNLDDINWTPKKNHDGSITFAAKIDLQNRPLIIEKKYSFADNNNSFKLSYKLINPGRRTLSFPETSIIISPSETIGPTLDYKNSYNTIAGIYSINKDFNSETKGSGFMSDKTIVKKQQGSIDWVGVMSRYLLVIMIPEKVKGTGFIFDNRDHTGYRTGINLPTKELRSKEFLDFSFKIYIGEKDKKILGSVDKSIIEAADVSKWIEPIRWFVMWSLLGINKLIGNMGWALVIFSIVSKIVFMPLTIKSTESMKKMQALTPKINELKAKYKGKADVIQKETMKLYKEHGVNPMGGCFPMLLQMPFFFALYSALINSIDLWNAPFMLWIGDLSMPDTIATIAGFNVNILPILMTITSVLQQKLTSVDTGNQQQKMMMYMMPLVLIFIFWNMPSGLVLYWTLQNGFQVLHQLYVNKKESKLKA